MLLVATDLDTNPTTVWSWPSYYSCALPLLPGISRHYGILLVRARPDVLPILSLRVYGILGVAVHVFLIFKVLASRCGRSKLET